MPDVEALRKHARTAAKAHGSLNLIKVCNHQFPAIEKDEHTLLNIYRQFDRSHRTTDYIDPAAEWLLDNFYVILEEIRTNKQICTRNYSGTFPAIGVSQKDAVPRVYALAERLIESSDAYLNEYIVCNYVNECQIINALTCREIWALPIMLKIALIRKIKIIALQFSEVDSGNLAIYLVALTESLKDMLKSPLIDRGMLMYVKE